MTTTYRTYSESKAKRAIANSKIMKKKIDRIIKNTPVPRLQAEIDAVERSNLQLCCPKCKTLHSVTTKEFVAGKFRRVCYQCYDKNLYETDTELYKEVMSKLDLPKDTTVSVFTHNPRHQIVITMPLRQYKKE
jgi:transposase-like protein